MKKVLIIANPQHAKTRLIGLVKHLKEFGWELVILAKNNNKEIGSMARVIETPFESPIYKWKRILGIKGSSLRRGLREKAGVKSKKSFLDRLMSLYASVFAYPDIEKKWIGLAVKKADEIMKEEKPDVILSMSFPYTTHVIAKKISQKHDIPWVADMIDPWSQNHSYPHGVIRKMMDTRLEKNTLSKANEVIIVSKPWADNLSKLHDRQVHAIPNGFDSDIENNKEELTKKFTITYVGMIYPKQDLTIILSALRNLIKKKKINQDVEMRIFAYKESWIQNEIEKYKLLAVVKQCGLIPREEVYKKENESQVLLLFNWEGEEGRGCYPLKIFEYIATRRPIIATGGMGEDVVDKLVDETDTGFYCKTVEDTEEILLEFYEEFKENGKVECVGNEKINNYSHTNMTKKIAEVLNEVI